MRHPRLGRRIGGLALKLLFMLVLTEVLLRLVLAIVPVPLLYLNYKTSEWLRDDHPDFGVWHLADAETTHVKTCTEATYTSNSHGMRDRPRTLEKTKPRVAVLGDSFTEGFLVDDDQTFSAVLEDQVFKGQAEFLNFGTSGSFGTTQEWLLYEHLARDFDPDVVIVAFLNENDLYDNSLWYWEDNPRRRPYLLRDAEAGGFALSWSDGETDRYEVGAAAKNLLMRFSFIARLANEVSLRARYSGPHPAAMDVYNTNLDANHALAWDTTRAALERLRDAVKRDGKQLLLVQLVDQAQIDPDRIEQVNAQAGFDTTFPNRHLELLARELGIRYLSLQSAFEAYRDDQKLEWPYFGLTCDRHWSPLGHEVAARAIGVHLQETGLLETP